jgi:hypothetical protein
MANCKTYTIGESVETCKYCNKGQIRSTTMYDSFTDGYIKMYGKQHSVYSSYLLEKTGYLP